MQKRYNKKLIPYARNLRKNMTEEERRLWFCFLRTYSVHFCRQKPIGKYIVDFYCAKAKLAIEIDGSQHYDDKNQYDDMERTKFIQQFGIEVLRFSNNQINQNFKEVCEYIHLKVEERIEL